MCHSSSIFPHHAPAYSAFPQTFAHLIHSILSCACQHIDLYLSSVIVLCQHLKELSAETASYRTSVSQVSAQNFFFMNEHQVGSTTGSRSNPHCSNVTPCELPPTLIPKRLSIQYTERCAPPLWEQISNFITETKQSTTSFIEFSSIILNDFRVQHFSSSSHPALLKSPQKITPNKWSNELLCKHKICFIFGQFCLFNRSLSYQIKFIFPITSTLLVLVSVVVS